MVEDDLFVKEDQRQDLVFQIEREEKRYDAQRAAKDKLFMLLNSIV